MTNDTTHPGTTVADFTARKARRLIAAASMIGLMFLSFLLSDREAGIVFGVIPEVEWVLILVACLSALVVFMVTMWRCPSCHRHLGGNLNPDSCPACGVRLAR